MYVLDDCSAATIRLQGSNRYSTAVEISKHVFPDPGAVDTVMVATGLNFPDALAGAAAGGMLGAPLLLVPGDSVPGVVASELGRLNPSTILVLGGSDVVSGGVSCQLAPLAAP